MRMGSCCAFYLYLRSRCDATENQIFKFISRPSGRRRERQRWQNRRRRHGMNKYVLCALKNWRAPRRRRRRWQRGKIFDRPTLNASEKVWRNREKNKSKRDKMKCNDNTDVVVDDNDTENENTLEMCSVRWCVQATAVSNMHGHCSSERPTGFPISWHVGFGGAGNVRRTTVTIGPRYWLG